MSRAAADLVRVCIDGRGPAGFSGSFYHKFSADPVVFASQDSLIQKMDQLFDELGYPQRSVQPRTFGAQPVQENNTKRREPAMARKAVNDLDTQQGELATFVVHVMYRQNATWQGNVLWAEADKSSSFRSALELIKLMDSALDAAGTPKECPPILSQENAGT